MKQKRTTLWAAALSASILALAACDNGGGGGGNSGSGSSSGGGASSLAISGTVIQAAVAGATVTAYPAAASGAPQTSTPLGTATTSSTGAFSLTVSLPSGTSAPVDLVLVSSGGTYPSEANTSTTITNSTSASVPGVSVLLPQVPAAGATGVVISPLTTIAASRAKGLIAGVNPAVVTAGKKSLPRAACSGTAMQCASSAADAAIESAFGLSGVSGPLSSVMPDFTATSGNSAVLAVVLGALEEEAMSQAQPPGAVVDALADDYFDGIPDGKGPGGGAVTFPGTTTTVPGSLGSSIFLSGMTTYINNSTSPPAGVTTASNGVTLSSSVPSGIRSGISSVAPASAALTTSSSGAVSEIIEPSNGHQIVLVAARAFGLQGLDISNPTTPVVNGYSTLNAALFALKDSNGVQSIPTVDAVTAVPGQADAEAVLSSFATAHVIVVDLDKQTVLKDSDFSATLTTQTTFSGGTAFISSSIYDSAIGANGGVLLATGNGFFAYDVGAGTLGTAIPLPIQSASSTSPDYPAENLGGATADTTIFPGGLLINGNYGPAGSGGGVDLVDIAGGKSYALSDTQFQANLAIPEPGGSQPFGIVDGNSMDTVFHVGLLTGEDVSYMGFIDLHSATPYTFGGTGTGGTFSAATPSAVMLGQDLKDDLGSPVLSGSAVESTTHLVLGIAAFSDTILVGQVDNPVAPANGTSWAGLVDWRYWNDSGTDYVSTAADPHAAGALFATGNNRSYGVTLSINGSAETVIMVDLQAFLSAAAAAVPTGGTLSHEHALAANPFGTSIIQSIPLTNTFSLRQVNRPMRTQRKKGSMTHR